MRVNPQQYRWIARSTAHRSGQVLSRHVVVDIVTGLLLGAAAGIAYHIWVG